MSLRQQTRPKPKRDLGTAVFETVVLLICMCGLAYLVYLFVTVVFLGESSACPQNFCP